MLIEQVNRAKRTIDTIPIPDLCTLNFPSFVSGKVEVMQISCQISEQIVKNTIVAKVKVGGEVWCLRVCGSIDCSWA